MDAESEFAIAWDKAQGEGFPLELLEAILFH